MPSNKQTPRGLFQEKRKTEADISKVTYLPEWELLRANREDIPDMARLHVRAFAESPHRGSREFYSQIYPNKHGQSETWWIEALQMRMGQNDTRFFKVVEKNTKELAGFIQFNGPDAPSSSPLPKDLPKDTNIDAMMDLLQASSHDYREKRVPKDKKQSCESSFFYPSASLHQGKSAFFFFLVRSRDDPFSRVLLVW